MNEEILKVKIMSDISDLKKGMGQVNSQMDGVKQKASSVSNGMKGLAKGIIAAFSVVAIVGFGKKIVETTAKLQAMDAQFGQIFKGTEGEEALKRIEIQAGALGIQGDRLKKSWNSFGAQFKGAGMDGEQAMNAVEKATALAADSAAFYDKSLEDTSGALASFMKGNFEAGDAIGVFTNAKQMDAQSNAMYGKSWKDLSEEERQWLLLDTVGKTYEMNGAMGQATRESQNYENVMGNLKAVWERFLAIIGAPILAVVVGIVTQLTDGFMWLSEKVKAIDWSSLSGGMDIMGTLKAVAQSVVDWFIVNWPLIKETAITVFDGLKTAAGEVVDFFVANWPWIQDIAVKAFEFIAAAWTDVLQPALEEVWETFKEIWPEIQTLVEGAFEGIQKVWDTVLKPVFEKITTTSTDIRKNWEKWETPLKVIGILIVGLAIAIGAYLISLQLATIATTAMTAATAFFGGIMAFLTSPIFLVVAAITAIIAIGYLLVKNWDTIKTAASTVWSTVKTTFGNLLTSVGTIFGNIKKAITDKIDDAKDAVGKAIEKIKGFFDFTWKFPKLKMPHFSITGSFSLAPPSIPKLGVDWWARGAIFKQPTMLGGQGVGDASNGFGSSPEVVAPLSELKQMLGLDRSNQSNGTVINLNGNYNFRDKDDMDYFMNQFAMATRRV